MKICGYCNKEYDKTESKCPYCGSTMVKMDHSTSGQDEYDRIEAEIKRKRQTRSAIIIGAVACVLIVLIVGITKVIGFVNDPQRDIDKTAEQMYATAQEYVDAGDYEAALEAADKINPQWSDYYQVDSLRAKAVKGQLNGTIAEYEAEGNYEAVIKYIDKNVEDVSSDKEIEEIYKNSVSKYKESVINKADEYLANKDYSAAVSVLTTATRLVGSDKQLDAKMFECNKAEILNKVSVYKAEGNYAKAIEYINENLDIINNDSDILIELSTCEDAFRNNIISKAEKAFENDGYEKALEIINDGLDILSDDSKLLDKKAVYEACAPVNISTLTPINGSFAWNYSNPVDPFGNSYSDSINTYEYSSYYDDQESVEYRLYGEYSRITGSIAPEAGMEQGNGVAKVRVNIYADGELKYSSDYVERKTDAFDFSVDIKDADYVVIELDVSAVYYEKASVILYDVLLWP